MQIIIVLGSILFLLGTLAGCGIDKGKYVGKWVHDPQRNGYYVETLEIKSDGRYNWYMTGELGMRFTSSGTWEVKKYEGEEGISFTPPIDYITVLKKKGNTFVEPVTGKSYVKQD